MKLSGNIIFITGGGSGIGRALAEALHKLGNQVIISGRRSSHLQDTVKANPGIQAVQLDVNDPANIAAVTQQLIHDYPSLNVLINNAGIMYADNTAKAIDDAELVATVTTNFIGPIRVTSALVEHLKAQPEAAIINVSSALAFIPLAQAAVYSATKAAIHSYTHALRHQLIGSNVEVIELAPPLVQTDLLSDPNHPHALNVTAFVADVLKQLESGALELLVSPADSLRNAAGPQEQGFVTQFNDSLSV
jgi:uncharacterized oxidoreductase